MFIVAWGTETGLDNGFAIGEITHGFPKSMIMIFSC